MVDGTITVIVAWAPRRTWHRGTTFGGQMDDSRPAAPRRRILLVDDDRDFGLWALTVLQAAGFEIQHVLDPTTALRQVESEPWDLVITDVEMPRMTGLEFLD